MSQLSIAGIRREAIRDKIRELLADLPEESEVSEKGARRHLEKAFFLKPKELDEHKSVIKDLLVKEIAAISDSSQTPQASALRRPGSPVKSISPIKATRSPISSPRNQPKPQVGIRSTSKREAEEFDDEEILEDDLPPLKQSTQVGPLKSPPSPEKKKLKNSESLSPSKNLIDLSLREDDKDGDDPENISPIKTLLDDAEAEELIGASFLEQSFDMPSPKRKKLKKLGEKASSPVKAKAQTEESESVEELIVKPPKKPTPKKDKKPSSEDEEESDGNGKRTKKSAQRWNARGSSPKKSYKDESSDEGEESSSDEKPKKRATPTKKKAGKAQDSDEDSRSEEKPKKKPTSVKKAPLKRKRAERDEDEKPKGTRKSPAKKQKKIDSEDEDEEDSEESDFDEESSEEEVPKKKGAKRKRSDSDESEEDEPKAKRARKSPQPKKKASPKKSPPKRKSKKKDDFVVSDDMEISEEGSEDESESGSDEVSDEKPKSNKKVPVKSKAAPSKKKSKAKEESEEEEDSESKEDEDDSEDQPKKGKGKGKGSGSKPRGRASLVPKSPKEEQQLKVIEKLKKTLNLCGIKSPPLTGLDFTGAIEKLRNQMKKEGVREGMTKDDCKKFKIKRDLRKEAENLGNFDSKFKPASIDSDDDARPRTRGKVAKYNYSHVKYGVEDSEEEESESGSSSGGDSSSNHGEDPSSVEVDGGASGSDD